jgi:hypothetical protein
MKLTHWPLERAMFNDLATMKPELWVAIVSTLTTLTLGLAALFINVRRDRLQHERDDKVRLDQQKREDAIRELERTHAPQIEFSIDCNFYGPQRNNYLVEVLLTVNNKGRVKQKFKDVTLRIRGIEENQPLEFWKKREPRLYFPHLLVPDVPVVPEGIECFFAEPGEKNTFTYVTKIPETIKFVLAYATFSYNSEDSHDAERVFCVNGVRRGPTA